MALPGRDPDSMPAGLEHMRRMAVDLSGVADRVTALEQKRASVVYGAGTPEGSVTSPVGTLYLRTNGGAGSTLYVKESGLGSTGWVAK